MRHYDKLQWIKYKKNQVEPREKEEMEDHLYTCDKCMDVFLSTIEEDEIEEASYSISEDFTENIMKKISNISLMERPRKKKRVINDFFLYYGAVAAVAIILTAGGVFGGLVDSVPKLSFGIEDNDNKLKTSAIFNLSESITNRTSDFINNFGKIGRAHV